MDFSKFKQLKQRLDSNDYYTNWVGIKNGAFLFSYLAQGAIIAFGFFYVYNVIYNVEPDWSPWLIGAISLSFLTAYEIFKRSITDKWAQDVVKNGIKSSGEFLILSLVSLLLYSGSFYVSLNGAMQFADKTTKISEETFQDINVVRDSIYNKYEQQILKYDSIKNTIVERQLNDPTIKMYNQAVERYSQRAWKTDKDLVESLKPSYDATIERYNKELADVDAQIQKLRDDRDADIKNAEEHITTKSEKQTELTQVSSQKFVIFSSIFEIIIIFGVWFRRYFQRRSIDEWHEKLQNDPKLARWYKWDNMLDILYRAKFNVLESGNQIQSAKDFVTNCKLEGIFISESEAKEFFKVLTTLEILETRGSRKYILQGYDGAKNILAKQFDVDVKKNK